MISVKMNKWVQKSIEIANAPGYLDRLAEVYSAAPTPRRPLPDTIREKIKHLYDQGDGLELLRLLLRLKGHPFPFEHPYVPLLRTNPDLLISGNPEVVKRVVQALFSLKEGEEDIIRGCERPADLNRVMSAAFQNWLRNYFPQRGFAFLPEPEFMKYHGKAFLDARNAHILEYANRNLGCRLGRGRDFLARTGNKFIIGEARFLSTVGGSQRRDVKEAVDFAKDKTGDAIKVAVLDGIIWFDAGMLRIIHGLKDDEPALSVLLLEDFLQSLR